VGVVVGSSVGVVVGSSVGVVVGSSVGVVVGCSVGVVVGSVVGCSVGWDVVPLGPCVELSPVRVGRTVGSAAVTLEAASRIRSRSSSEHAPARSPTSMMGTTMRYRRRLM